jgi:hypothetical protein
MASIADDSYVTSYVCPKCKTFALVRPDGGLVGAIGYRLPLPLHPRCANCGTDVPSDHWRFERLERKK